MRCGFPNHRRSSPVSCKPLSGQSPNRPESTETTGGGYRVRAQTRNGTGKHGGEPQPGLVIPAPPTDEEKASYAWRPLPFLATCLTLSALCVVVAQAWMEINYPVTIPFAIYTVTYFLYQAVSIPVNFAGRNFDLTAHELRAMTWQPRRFPD